MKSLTGSFRPGLESITWNSFLIEKFIDDGKYVLDVFQAKLTDTRKFSSSMEKLIRDISQSSLIQEGDFGFENIKCVNIQVFIDILESKCNERVKEMLAKYRQLGPILLNLEMAVNESSNGNNWCLEKCYEFWEQQMYYALLEVMIRSLLCLSSIFRGNFRIECNVQVGLRFSNTAIDCKPSARSIERLLKRCIQVILEFPKSFKRWMHQSCMEVEPYHTQDQNGNKAAQNFSFYDDLIQNKTVMNAVANSYEDIQFILKKLATKCSEWEEYDVFHSVKDSKRRKTMDRLLEICPSCQFFDAKLT